jgi:hypothetical protein
MGTTERRVPVKVEVASQASEPCGAVARWALELVKEQLGRKSILDEMNTVEADIRKAKAKLDMLEDEAMKMEQSPCAVPSPSSPEELRSVT